MTHTAIGVVPCAFAVVPFAKFQYKLSFSSYSSAPYHREIAVPLQDKVQDLCMSCTGKVIMCDTNHS